ncbi:hypothetical protein A2331_05760 [Candidatus Falkowbacteria bacterium RIFOXYB2_FULL_34_18]|uniref:N-acetyltransferase domain-containing protein n=1 Tax=Candidatus Falkowbacteria bacterium RIFOXYD2_FULL_34_120 TaxID=1798007 RepID=A0A1F5TM31_9BACT|nr:MAG: hypothetical protein A2331_05760 [Candidatus Falkowbacteria bacterium RIFOXYB2_FULL_34_18]OGF29153.1 MAG: hypothetical protein A2500_05705 [Candidatus Falkowbacteria bacterium RIFOXYC12_FULL_34_55]OGF36959.1 MAG: hypothetical protein A2466_07085 [Candidatus Falkowbacteria bacterium RIFOXYC2_FULL_34_220]OGF38675.1 MAG: hypothetical protein A2515_01370 [Candidatus Falkowbacteria bacterium RIFOXYD12_FULL_34_57]OGF39909.1 MAG: hypothetical protein A2531_01625 [Candidatus Falkowbacteria bact
MKIVNLNREQLNSFVGAQKHSQFLQSWEWGEFQESWGNKVVRLGFEDQKKLVMALTLIKVSLPFLKSYLFAPRIGIKYLTEDQLKFIFDSIEGIAQKEKAIFFRFEPRTKFSISNFTHQTTMGQFLIYKTIDIQPPKTIILNLEKEEEELLRAMHQKTRYNIGLAQRKGIFIREGNPENDFEEFWRIMEQTKDRDMFRSHSKGYYRKMLLLDNIKLFVAEFEGRVISANIISFFGNMATYIHGASSNEHRNIMAPYLLQWHVIKLAKEKGYKYYDFHGIDAQKWPGVTRFKKGFGGDEINYQGTFDLVFDKCWYILYKLVRKMRRMI